MQWTQMWPPLQWGAECKILKQPYKQYQRKMRPSSLCCCTYGINKVCTIKQISSQWYKTAQPVVTVKLRNQLQNIIFTSYVTYLTVTIFIIHTQHYLNDINLYVYSKGKGYSSIVKTNKIMYLEIFIIPSAIFPIHHFAVNGQDWGACIEEMALGSINLQSAVATYYHVGHVSNKGNSRLHVS